MRQAVFLVAASELRQRARSLAGLALLVTLVAAVVFGAAAGARRTESSFDRLGDVVRARDATIQLSLERDDAALPAVGELESLPFVEASGRVVIAPVYPDPQQVADDEFDLNVMASPDGRYFVDVDRPLLLRGRMPDPSSPTEVVLNELAAGQSGLGVGDSLDVATFTPDDLEQILAGEPFPGFNGAEVHLDIVGVARQIDELGGSSTYAGPTVIAAPAFITALGDDLGAFCCSIGVRLANGEADLEALRAASRELGEQVDEVLVAGAGVDFADSARDAIGVLATSLWVFTLVAGVAGALAVGGAISRQVAGASGIGPTLHALGLSRRAVTVARALPVGAALAAGLVAGAAVAVATSGLLPFGLARRAEPSPGVTVDAVVVVGGVLVATLAAASWTLFCAWRQQAPAGAPTTARPSTAAAAAAGFGMGPSAVTGLRHAFERGSTGRSVPVRSAFLAALLGIGGVVAVATVGASLDGLVDAPERYGWGWQAEPDTEGQEPEALASLAGDDRLDGVAMATNRQVEIGGLGVQGLSIESVRGQVDAVLRDGTRPTSPTEVALGAQTADELDVAIGDTVTATDSGGDETVPLRVVGIAVFRPVDNPNPGEGALLTPDGLDAIAQSDGFQQVLLRYPEGADPQAYEQFLTEDHPLGFSVYSYPRLPGSVTNLERTGGVLRALGVFFAFLGIAGVGHALLVSVRRRRHDFAVLRALGWAGHQVRAAVSWQAAAIAAVGTLLGIPLGIAAGHAAWQVLIGDLGLIDDPTNPALALAVIAPASIAVAVLLARWPGRLAAQGHPMTILRSE